MTRKDYELIATTRRDVHHDAWVAEAKGLFAPSWRGAENAIYRLALALALDSPRFNRERFLAAATKGVG